VSESSRRQGRSDIAPTWVDIKICIIASWFRRMSWNRILSGLLAVGYIVFAFFAGGAKGALILAMFVILPLACIWFSEAMGGYIGPVWRGSITHSSPGLAVCVAGWLLLLLPVAVALF
jgi:hypothetical protein